MTTPEHTCAYGFQFFGLACFSKHEADKEQDTSVKQPNPFLGMKFICLKSSQIIKEMIHLFVGDLIHTNTC